MLHIFCEEREEIRSFGIDLKNSTKISAWCKNILRLVQLLDITYSRENICNLVSNMVMYWHRTKLYYIICKTKCLEGGKKAFPINLRCGFDNSLCSPSLNVCYQAKRRLYFFNHLLL